MNKIFLLLLLSIPIISFSQKSKKNKNDKDSVVQIMPLVDSMVVYTEVVKADSITKEELYNRAKRFFVENYKSANDVVQLDDKENGEIIGKGIFKVMYNQGIAGMQPTSVYHTISVAVKEGRYKYEIKDLIIDYYSPGTRIGTSYISGTQVHSPVESWLSSKIKMIRRYLTDINSHIETTIEQLKAMMTKNITTKKEDW